MRHRNRGSKSGAMMVGPPSREERASEMTRVKVGIVLLVGVSGGLIALHGGADVLGVAAATVSALAVGALLAWYLTWITR